MAELGLWLTEPVDNCEPISRDLEGHFHVHIIKRRAECSSSMLVLAVLRYKGTDVYMVVGIKCETSVVFCLRERNLLLFGIIDKEAAPKHAPTQLARGFRTEALVRVVSSVSVGSLIKSHGHLN